MTVSERQFGVYNCQLYIHSWQLRQCNLGLLYEFIVSVVAGHNEDLKLSAHNVFYIASIALKCGMEVNVNNNISVSSSTVRLRSYCLKRRLSYVCVCSLKAIEEGFCLDALVNFIVE